MSRSNITTDEMAVLPEAELMVDVKLIPSGGGAAAPVYACSDLDQVLEGEAPASEVWDDDDDDDELFEAPGRRRWMFGGLAAVVAVALLAGVLVVTVGQPSEAADRPEVIPSTLETTPPAMPVPDEEPEAEAALPAATMDITETARKRSRPRARRGATSKEDLRKQVLEAMGVDGEIPAPAEPAAPVVRRVRNTNTPMFLASRIYRRNKRTLLACDRLARRRGEDLNNSRALFRVSVEASGAGTVKVTGTNVDHRRMSCYQVMARRWRLPATGSAYRTAFRHIN